MSELGAWVKQVRTSMALSQEKFGEKFGELFACAKGNVSAWENDRHAPSADQVMQMARLSGLPLPGRVAAEPAASYFNAEEIPISTSVPLISWVQAGAWSDVADPFAPGVAEQWLPCPVRHGPHTYALRVRGESMYNPEGRPLGSGHRSSHCRRNGCALGPGDPARHRCGRLARHRRAVRGHRRPAQGEHGGVTHPTN